MAIINSEVNTSAPVGGQPEYDLFVFGDSLSDIGNLFNATGKLFPPSPPFFNGRVSNGSLAVETLAQQLGLPLTLETDFAIAGARTDNTNVLSDRLGGIPLGGLQKQIDQFKTQAQSLGAGAEDIYVVWAGANDFLQLLSTPPADPKTVISSAVNNLVSSVRTLIESGAKNVLVAQLPNLGLTPLVVSRGGQTPALLAQLTQNFNSELQTAMSGLEKTFPNSNIILSDTFTRSNQVAQDPGAFGFTNITDQLLLNPTATNPEGFFFWDDFHPTTQGHEVFADLFRNDLIAGITDPTSRTGTAQDDRLVGFAGSDSLTGRGGKDYLEGNAGRDSLFGGADNDILVGGDNRDLLLGDLGRDTLTGGTARDRFVYTNTNQGRDQITDFEVGKDKINLAGIFDRRNYDRPNPFEAYIRIAQTSAGAVVRVDSNGDRAGGFKPLALLAGVDASDLGRSSFSFAPLIRPL